MSVDEGELSIGELGSESRVHVHIQLLSFLLSLVPSCTHTCTCISMYMYKYMTSYVYSLLIRAYKLETATVHGLLACLAPPFLMTNTNAQKNIQYLVSINVVARYHTCMLAQTFRRSSEHMQSPLVK